ncbi:MAG: GYD domain-containing protein [Actinomycetota bacterium]|nr:GYD domain-containing protein [Actinomycetota bacterium]
MGGKILGQYAVLWEIDFINIVDAPDNDTISRISVQLASRGSVRITTPPSPDHGRGRIHSQP